MQYFTSLLAAAAIVQAATPVVRQASPSSVVRSALEAIISDAGAVQSAVAGLTADSSASDIAGAEATIQKLQSDVDGGASSFAGLAMISDTDGYQLADLIQPLETSTSDAVNAVIAQKSVIVGLCVGPVAYSSFQGLVSSAQTFATNLEALFSSTLQPIVAGAAQNVEASLNQGLQAFSDSQTAPSTCGGSGGNGGSTTTPPTGGSTTTPPPSSSTGKCYRRRHRNRH